MSACFCIGPQNGEPECPCAMRNATIRNGRYVKPEVDLGPAPTPFKPSPQEIQMSYSFGVKAANKAEALSQIAEKLAEVVKGQPVHAADVKQAQATCDTFVGLLETDEANDVLVSVSGSVWKSGEGVRSVSINVNASMAAKAAQ